MVETGNTYLLMWLLPEPNEIIQMKVFWKLYATISTLDLQSPKCVEAAGFEF
jgi:hypothetical protein